MTPTRALQPTLRLLAPLDGWIVPLEKVPDPVFAQRIVGDGVSIDPTSSLLLAPCGGEVVHAHAAGHALTLRSDGGLELLLHVGVDTVQLKGEGFKLLVKAGDRVAPGQALVEFDADAVARKAKSLQTQLLVTNADLVASLTHPSGRVEAGKSVALEIVLRGEATPEGAAAPGLKASSDALVVPNPTGLHARPASILAHAAKRFRSVVHLRRGEAKANARSLVSIMGLNVKQGDKVFVLAEGPDAQEAVAELSRLITAGLEEKEAPASTQLPALPRSEDPRAIGGVCASPGLAIGTAFQFRREEVKVPELGEGPAIERARLAQALEKAKAELETMQARLSAQHDPGKAAIFGAHRELLDDPELLEVAEAAVAKGASAAAAMQCAATDFAGRLTRLNNDLLAGRAADVKDVGLRVLRILTGAPAKPREYPKGCVLLAEDLTPSDTVGFDPEKVLGVCTVGGGGTSHVAILCRSLAIPALAAAELKLLAVPDGAPLILDADKGFLLSAPSEAELEAARARQAKARVRRDAELVAAREEARTQDGRRIRVEANIGKASEAEAAARSGAEGVGLCRSEFLFLERDAAPSEDEQVEAYAAMARAFPGGAVVVRVLDVGGDKRLPYLALAQEENPFLGERGIRLLLERPKLFRTQLRALLRASKDGPGLKVLFPMVADLEEFRAAKAMLAEEARLLGVPPLPAGVMIEVPSAALLSEPLAREADFFSIGTNDLTQYTLAMDRGNPKLAARVDALHPAVLKMIRDAVEGAKAHDRPVGVCGGAAGDLQAVPLLIGLGVGELSLSPASVPAVKAAVRRLDAKACEELARRALALTSAAEVRALTVEREEAA
ncbi:MAG TPA: phosphoenolpyruvate--protein phosphotransferase [Elusimicrobia bacterium]|nr:phosphoenolpyruvate--protein phosphotransferase [Elusimicrobiota bacterium]